MSSTKRLSKLDTSETSDGKNLLRESYDSSAVQNINLTTDGLSQSIDSNLSKATPLK